MQQGSSRTKEKLESIDKEEDAPIRLALRPKDAAAALGIGERLLSDYKDIAKIPHFKLGAAVLYPVDALREWLASQVCHN